jgi:hypothetical protein
MSTLARLDMRMFPCEAANERRKHASCRLEAFMRSAPSGEVQYDSGTTA